ncbi:MAG: uroporphyrinogen synthase [Caulobacter sp.]|nr:uroporphyrinogen synthase [Caulobacter sp.]
MTAEPRRRIWITRAQPGAAATARRVTELGHAPHVDPLLEVRRLETALDLTGVGALAFTSANGVAAFAEASPNRSLRVFAVGQATAAAAKAAGFTGVMSTDGDVAVLAAGIAARRAELKGLVVLHPGAAEPAQDLSALLAEFGVAARAAPLYETVSRKPDPATLETLDSLDAVLVQSPKAARALALLLRRHPAPRTTALCVSPAAAKPLLRAQAAGRLKAVAFAPLPLESALLNLIARHL